MANTGNFDASDTDRLWKETGMTNHPANGEDVQAWDDEADAADNCFIFSAGAPTYVAASMNGLGSLDFDGTTDQMIARDDANTTSRAASTFLSVSAYTVMVAFQLEADATNNGTIYLNTPIVSDGSSFWGIHLKTSGGVHTAYLYNWDGGAKNVGQDFLRDVPNVFLGRFDGSDLYVSINGASESSTSSGNNSNLGAAMFMAVNYPGKIGEVRFWNTGDADGNLATEWADFQAKWLGGGGGSTFPALSVAI